MSGTKDPAIKLFGKTISLPLNEEIPRGTDSTLVAVSYEDIDVDQDHLPSSTSQDDKSSRFGEEQERTKDSSRDKASETKEGDDASPSISQHLKDPDTSSGNDDNPKTPSVDKENPTPKPSKTDEQIENSSLQEKTLKKPDKIIPCPRCNSMDTKFCYYNNYNVSQPRHFCKNCQRYWTAGGTMRNVPVGAGRRKNKNSASHYRHISVTEALQTARTDSPDGIHHPTMKPNGTILTFGSDSPLCESMASVLNVTEKTMRNCTRNGFHGPEEHRIPVSCGGGGNKDDHSSRSSVTASNSMEEGSRMGLKEPLMQNFNGFPPQIPCFPGAPWPFPWSSTVPPPAFCPSNFPISFYPTATYWGCTVPGTWSIPWLSPPTSSPNPGPNSPLGKHSRDGNMINQSNSEKEDSPKESNSERCLWIPKTLRIDDPGEAARSSIWATLGIKNDKADSINGGGLFKAFQSKGDEKNHRSDTSQVLHANPAALSRSLNFHESS